MSNRRYYQRWRRDGHKDRAGKLHPEKLIGKTISLQQAPEELMQMDNFSGTGVTVIDRIP